MYIAYNKSCHTDIVNYWCNFIFNVLIESLKLILYENHKNNEFGRFNCT